MSAIAYITDSKMLELHRLNNHKIMNFWRPSGNINFTDFGEDDLLFFLSKDKEHRKKKEKGIVGFGRVKQMQTASTKTMWDRYGIYNGYNTYEEFKEAILKVCKDKKLPKKISGFLLEDVTFFQPVYLSECGMKISNNIESYIYLKSEKTVLNLLDLAKQSGDLWSDFTGNAQAIEKEKLLYALSAAHETIGDIPYDEKTSKKAYKAIRKYAEENKEFRFVRKSRYELYTSGTHSIDLLFYYDKDVDERLLIGQAQLYKYYLGIYFGKDIAIRFLSQERNENIEYYMNALL